MKTIVKKNPRGKGYVAEVHDGDELVSRVLRSTTEQAARAAAKEASVDKSIAAGKSKSQKSGMTAKESEVFDAAWKETRRRGGSVARADEDALDAVQAMRRRRKK